MYKVREDFFFEGFLQKYLRVGALYEIYSRQFLLFSNLEIDSPPSQVRCF
jgi:hypothetical protein